MGLWRSLFCLFGAVAVLPGAARSSADLQAQAPLTDDFVCEHPPYKVHIVSKSPLVIYIADFVTPTERAHLRQATYVPIFPLRSTHSPATNPVC